MGWASCGPQAVVWSPLDWLLVTALLFLMAWLGRKGQRGASRGWLSILEHPQKGLVAECPAELLKGGTHLIDQRSSPAVGLGDYLVFSVVDLQEVHVVRGVDCVDNGVLVHKKLGGEGGF